MQANTGLYGGYLGECPHMSRPAGEYFVSENTQPHGIGEMKKLLHSLLSLQMPILLILRPEVLMFAGDDNAGERHSGAA